jgi:hypothetical protein
MGWYIIFVAIYFIPTYWTIRPMFDNWRSKW